MTLLKSLCSPIKMIDFTNANFLTSLNDISKTSLNRLNEVVLLGKSNVGKSSFLNALTSHRHLAYISSKPGRTRLLNYYLIDGRFYLVDAPGYGFAFGGKKRDAFFKSLMDAYFLNNQYIKLALVLIDARRGISEDDNLMIDFLKEKKLPYFLIFTKADKITLKEKAALKKDLAIKNIDINDTFLTSIHQPRTYNPLKTAVAMRLNED